MGVEPQGQGVRREREPTLKRHLPVALEVSGLSPLVARPGLQTFRFVCAKCQAAVDPFVFFFRGGGGRVFFCFPPFFFFRGGGGGRVFFVFAGAPSFPDFCGSSRSGASIQRIVFATFFPS